MTPSPIKPSDAAGLYHNNLTSKMAASMVFLGECIIVRLSLSINLLPGAYCNYP